MQLKFGMSVPPKINPRKKFNSGIFYMELWNGNWRLSDGFQAATCKNCDLRFEVFVGRFIRCGFALGRSPALGLAECRK